MADPVHLRIPVDASEVPDRQSGQLVKVVARDPEGKLFSQTIKLDDKGHGVADLVIDERPASLRVALGPENAPDEDLFGMQTLAFDVTGQQLAAGREVKLGVTKITPFYWTWWRRWCRRFTIRGRVLCPDGRPAPGALVCAYDVDFWWWWSSSQKVGCATTAVDGTFQISFTWCCGFLPWWWWLRRYWKLEPILADRILPVLRKESGLRGLPLPSPRPDLSVFESFLSGEGGLQPPRPAVPTPGRITLPTSLTPLNTAVNTATSLLRPRDPRLPKGQIDPTVLSDLRDKMVRKLPPVPSLERLHLWPWYPWQPWFDCSPDIIFRVTQDCPEPGTVILNEGPWDTRWDIPTSLDVTLVADQGCCLHQGQDPHGACIVPSSVCGVPIERIGGNYGNVGALPAQRGYASPGLVDEFGDQPFAEVVDLYAQLGDSACDYYELEFFNDIVSDWRPLPEGSVAGFTRRFHGPWVAGSSDPLSPFHYVDFPVHEIDLHQVLESRKHFEQTHDPGTWGSSGPRIWTETNYDLLARWITATYFANGTYRLRVIGWTLAADGHLTNRRVLPVCDENPPIDNELVVTIDNRFVGDMSGHPTAPGHVCGVGTVHLCTTEPDTDFIEVNIIRTDPVTHVSTKIPVRACGNVAINDTDLLQVDFLVTDPAGHLAYYTLGVTYAENLVRWLVRTNCPECPGGVDLLASVPGATLVPLTPGVPTGPQYGDAAPGRSALSQGATSPKWYGGSYRLTIKARDVFPETCCYQLELWAAKRTIVSCSTLHTNQSHYTFLVAV